MVVPLTLLVAMSTGEHQRATKFDEAVCLLLLFSHWRSRSMLIWNILVDEMG